MKLLNFIQFENYGSFHSKFRHNTIYQDREYNNFYYLDDTDYIKVSNHKISGVFGEFISGQYYNYSKSSSLSSVKHMVANEIILSPCILPESLTIDKIGLNVQVSMLNSNFKILIYKSNYKGILEDLLFESVDIDSSTTGFKEVDINKTLIMNNTYWVGILSDSNISVSAIPNDGCFNLGGDSNKTACLCSINTVLQNYNTPNDLSEMGITYENGRSNRLPAFINFRKQ